MIAAAGVSCPRCKRSSVVPLAKEGDKQRFQCLVCTESFVGPAMAEVRTTVGEVPEPEAALSPAARVAFLPIASADPADFPVRGAEPAGKCGKCLKPYLRLGKKYDEHVARCDGTPWVAKVHRVRTARAAAGAMPPKPAEVYRASIESLNARRESLLAEIRGIDVAIADLQGKLQGAGGSPAAPFVPSASVPSPRPSSP